MPAKKRISPPTPGPDPRRADPAWWRATLAAIALATAALAVVAFGFHPIGDYFTESDFYGAYAKGAELIRHGQFDASRYGIYGPVYELALAAVSALTREAFVAARLISVVSACALLVAAAWVARRRLGAAAAWWLVVFIAVNPTFFRYGYSAGTDMLATALAVGSMAVLLAGESRRAMFAAGLLVGLATFTRYNLVSFVPAGLVAVLFLAQAPWPDRARRAALYLAGAALIALPYTGYAVAVGHPPAMSLVSDAGYYLADDPGRALETRYRALAAPDTAARAAPPASAAPSLASRIVTGAVRHLAEDARTLLGWPVAALALLALLLLLLRRRASPLVPFVPFAAFAFLALAPVFYSERYSLVLLPIYLAPAALGLMSLPASRLTRAGAAVAALIALVVTVDDNLTLQRTIHESIPTEALSAGRMIRAEARPGDRVLARKAHIAYAAGLEPVLFPEVNSLDSLAAYSRAHDVRFLYFSWYESRIRPQFAYLLDTTLAVPGLTPIWTTRDKPSVTYRVGPEFGETPSWVVRAAMAGTGAGHGPELGAPSDSGHVLARRASDELAANRLVEALASADAAARLLPGEADPHVLRGEALTRLARPIEALAAFDEALALEPHDVPAHLGRGWVLLSLGRLDEAGRAWRPVIGATTNPTLLRAMVALYTRLGDRESAGAAQAALRRVAPTP